MNTALKQAIDDAFAGYEAAAQLDALKAEMLAALEDEFLALRKKGIIEEAAVKRLASSLGRSIKSADSASGGDKQKRLELIARSLEINPLGRGLALTGSLARLAAACAPMAAFSFWFVRRDPYGGIIAIAPFAALAAGLFAFVKLRRYRAGRAQASTGKAVLAAVCAAAIAGAAVASVAALAFYMGNRPGA